MRGLAAACTPDELRKENWDGDSFREKYGEGASELAESVGVDVARRPRIEDVDTAARVIGYRASYSFGSALRELEEHGPAGPPGPKL